MAKKSRGGKVGSSVVSGEVSYQKIIQASPNTITFGKNVSITPDGYLTESGRKKDLEKLINKYNIDNVVMNTSMVAVTWQATRFMAMGPTGSQSSLVKSCTMILW